MIHEKCYYSKICIMNIIVPEAKQGGGLYKSFLQSIDETKMYGIRWHDSVNNEYLIQRHRRQGYFEVNGSFYFVIGNPYPEAIQKRMRTNSQESEMALAQGINSKLPGLRKKRRRTMNQTNQ